MSRVIYEELQDKEGNVHYLHTEDKVVFDENGQSLRAAMTEVQFEDYTGTAELPSVETAVAGITRGRKWTDLFGNIKAALKGLKAKDEAIEGSMGDAFSEEKSYAVGDYAIYKDVLYKFTAAKTAGSWDAAKVRAVTVVGEVCSLNANIGKKQDASTAITTGNIGQQSVKHATTAGSSSAVAWGNVSGKPGTYPPSGHNHDDRYYTETEVNAKINNMKKVELILEYSDLKSDTKSFVLSKNWANFKYVYVGIACKSDIGYLWKGGLIIPTEMIKIASGNYQVSCIYDLTDFYVNAEVDFSNANHINSRITSHGSDAGFSNARIYVFGLEEP